MSSSRAALRPCFLSLDSVAGSQRGSVSSLSDEAAAQVSSHSWKIGRAPEAKGIAAV